MRNVEVWFKDEWKQDSEEQPARNWFHLGVLMAPPIALAGLILWSWTILLFGAGLELWSFGNHANVHHKDTVYAAWWFRFVLAPLVLALALFCLKRYGL
jgi:hypothetical protein